MANNPKSKDSVRGQQLSDKYINSVAKKRITYEDAMKKQKAEDSTKVVNKITTKKGTSSVTGGRAGSKTRIAKHRLNKDGNMTSY